MCEPSDAVYPPTETAAALARADALECEITELCAHINAANYRLLQLIAELDELQPWGAWGLASCAHWLNWRCGIGLNAAREKVRVAHALKSLPAIGAAFADGELSFSKVRALTRVADATSEAYLLDLARRATAAQVEQLVRGYRRAGRLDEAERAMAQHAARELRYYTDDDGSLVIRARLPAEEGEILVKAIEAALDAQRADGDDAPAAQDVPREEDPAADDVTAVTSAPEIRPARRRADALVALAETMLRHGPRSPTAADRYQVVVQVSAEALAGDAAGRCEIDGGPRLAPDTARRLACDASVVQLTGDRHGNPLDIGRKKRVVGPALRRALQARDGGCRFPGCTRRRFVDAHHVRHWADGGETSIDNLVLLCRHHHRLVHEGGFGLDRSADGELRFTRPHGRAIDASPPLPAGGSIERLQRDKDATGRAIGACSWILPGDPLDHGIAVGELLRLRQSGTSNHPATPTIL